MLYTPDTALCQQKSGTHCPDPGPWHIPGLSAYTQSEIIKIWHIFIQI